MWNVDRSRLRNPMSARRARGTRAALRCEALEARDVPAVIDLTTAGTFASVGTTLVQQTNVGPTGSGVFNAFLGLRTNTDIEQGINTSARPLQFDEIDDPHTRDLLLSEVPIVTLNGTVYRQFVLDINQEGGQPLLSLDELRIFASNTAGLSGYDVNANTFAGLSAIFDLDATADNTIMVNYNKGGSGNGDMYLYVPASAFGNQTYVYLYSKFGGQEPNNDGFEEWGVLTAAAPAIAIDKVTVSATQRGDGISVLPNEQISWVYTVTNTGNVPLNRIRLVDDNGTLANWRDDFRPTYVSGDVNGNHRLDVGESWIFTAQGVARFNTYSNTATVTGAMVASNRTVRATDVSSYLIRTSIPQLGGAVTINKQTVFGTTIGDNIQVRAGAFISWQYTVTNTGTAALDQVRVVDDNGTPTNALDDFQARYVAGDVNVNGRLDVGETWTFRAFGIAGRNDYTNIGTVFAHVVGTTELVSARDASSYFTPAALGAFAVGAPPSKRFLITTSF